MKKHFGLLLLVAVLFFACANQSTFDFAGKTIQLVELDGEAVDSAATAVPVILTFSDQEQQVNGTAGCNALFGPYSVDGNNIKFENLGLTRRMCDEFSNGIETKLTAALQNTDNYKFEEGKLFFFKGETLLAVFEVK